MRQRVAFLRTLMAGPPRAAAGRAVRLARRDHPRPRCSPGSPACSGPTGTRSLLVTHDVEEALYLSDRVLVLSSRPATVADRIEIDRLRGPPTAPPP